MDTWVSGSKDLLNRPIKLCNLRYWGRTRKPSEATSRMQDWQVHVSGQDNMLFFSISLCVTIDQTLPPSGPDLTTPRLSTQAYSRSQDRHLSPLGQAIQQEARRRVHGAHERALDAASLRTLQAAVRKTKDRVARNPSPGKCLTSMRKGRASQRATHDSPERSHSRLSYEPDFSTPEGSKDGAERPASLGGPLGLGIRGVMELFEDIARMEEEVEEEGKPMTTTSP